MNSFAEHRKYVVMKTHRYKYMIKSTNFVLRVIIFLIYFLLSSSQTIYAQDNLPQEKSLYGIWLSEKISRGGLKSILEFKEDGVLIHRRSVWLDFKYKIENTSITLISTGNNTENKIIKGNIQIKDGKLELKLNGKDTIIMKREDNRVIPDNSKYIGQWSFKQASGITGYYIFKPEGNLLFRIPVPGATIRYFSTIDNIIETKGKDIKPSKMKWNINKNGLLILQDIDTAKSWSYKRFIE